MLLCCRIRRRAHRRTIIAAAVSFSPIGKCRARHEHAAARLQRGRLGRGSPVMRGNHVHSQSSPSRFVGERLREPLLRHLRSAPGRCSAIWLCAEAGTSDTFLLAKQVTSPAIQMSASRPKPRSASADFSAEPTSEDRAPGPDRDRAPRIRYPPRRARNVKPPNINAIDAGSGVINAGAVKVPFPDAVAVTAPPKPVPEADPLTPANSPVPAVKVSVCVNGPVRSVS